MMRIQLVFCVVLFSLVFSHNEAVKCRDENDNPVDWFYVYKLPKLEEDNVPHKEFLHEGGAYAYMTSSEHGKWISSNVSITDSISMIANTLKPLYNDNQNIFYFLYNDEPPNEPKDEQKGHTKGVVLGDENGGIWLLHSVPQFPEPGRLYTYPASGLRYGQNFLCLSLDLDNINNVGLQLQYNDPHIYESKMLDSVRGSLHNLIEAASGDGIIDPPWYHETTLSSGGIDFNSFAKTKLFEKDLYVDLVANELKSNLLVETWLNGRGRLASDCSGFYSVKNVESLMIKEMKYRSTLDHSKWAVSEDETQFWVCVGDINREEHQELRGGGTVCVNNKLIGRAYRQLVQDVEECSKENEMISTNDLF